MTTTNLDFLDPYCSLSHFYFMVYKHPLRETCSIKSISFSRMTKARTCQKSQGNEKWYDLVINAGPEMESYFHKILACSYSRILPNNFTLLPKLDCSNGFILIQKMNGKYFFCPECGEYATMQNLREDSYEASVEETYCLHSKAAKILEIKDDKKSATELNGKKEQVFLVQNEPFPVYIVYPQENKKDAKGSKVAPGVVVRTAKMSKHRCKSCKGRDGCIHLSIYRQAQDEVDLLKSLASLRMSAKEKDNQKTNIGTDLVENDVDLNKKPVVKPKSTMKNELNPEKNHGEKANVFKQSFSYPPSKEDRERNNIINKVNNLFPTNAMIPNGVHEKSCEKCGNLFSKVSLESKHPIIHHGKPTSDSRNSDLVVYCLQTEECDCKLFYVGGEDRLVRVSTAPAQPQSKVHFVSVDLLNEYLCSLFGKSQEGKSIDAFVNNKNILNSEERGDEGTISKQVFLKAFEIYIHAINYVKEDAFGCELCPTELEDGENEDNFEGVRELHVVDGIDMGCQENEAKGFVDEDLFSVQKVPG